MKKTFFLLKVCTSRSSPSTTKDQSASSLAVEPRQPRTYLFLWMILQDDLVAIDSGDTLYRLRISVPSSFLLLLWFDASGICQWLINVQSHDNTYCSSHIEQFTLHINLNDPHKMMTSPTDDSLKPPTPWNNPIHPNIYDSVNLQSIHDSPTLLLQCLI